MTKRLKKIILRNFEVSKKELRIIFLKHCDPLYGAAPDDEYDSIIHQILSQLRESTPAKDIESYILQEFEENWGITVPQEDATNLVSDCITWWNNKSSSASTNAG